jgi:hypothetical protein
VQLSEDGAVATQTGERGWSLTTTGAVELTEDRHYWEVELVTENAKPTGRCARREGRAGGWVLGGKAEPAGTVRRRRRQRSTKKAVWGLPPAEKQPWVVTWKLGFVIGCNVLTWLPSNA